MMCVWEDFPHGTPNCVQVPIIQLLIGGETEQFGQSPSSLFHPLCTMYQHHWQQNSPDCDATITMLDICYSVLRFESLTFTPPHIPLIIVAKYIILCLV